jgi:transposase
MVDTYKKGKDILVIV